MSGWRTSSYGTVAALAAAMTLTACGGGARQDANEPSGNFSVQVVSARFPTTQHLAQHTHMTIVVRNTGSKAIPDLAVTVCNTSCAYNQNASPGQGTSAQAFGAQLSMPNLANSSRAVWIVDHPPGLCGYSCKSGGAGGDVTAYANTWALGHPLKPGHTATFDWAVTAVHAGQYVVAWEVAAGLNGKAKAIGPDGSAPNGKIRVTISHAPEKSYVNNAGKIVKTS